RIDHQVNVRGYRIELGDIENQLLKHTDLKEVAVAARTRTTGEENEPQGDDMFICAYFKTDKDVDVHQLRIILSEALPDYMVPSYFIKVDEIPLTATGKIDRKSLPEPQWKEDDGYIPPRDKVDETLVEIWAEIFEKNKSEIGIDADFFNLGGHSFNALVLAGNIHKRLDVVVSIADMFNCTTLKELSDFIKGKDENRFYSIPAAPEKEYYKVSSAQKRLYLVQQMQPDSIQYNLPILTHLEGKLDTAKFEKTFREMSRRHQSLRTSFHLKNNELVQKIHDISEIKIKYHETDTEKAKELVTGFKKPFDLSKAPLIRAMLVKTGEETHILGIDMHHIISDLTSMIIFIKETMALYEGQTPP
ncbi:MAG: non-ribosomal peptide synthetase, partial [bacterium]|nr:non-ribosomal peptide synthetase [bacterium]